MNNSVRVKS